jgi:hypothetical protein
MAYHSHVRKRASVLGRLAAGIAAFLALAAALAGLPWVLVVVAGSPVPSDSPAPAEVWTLLTSPDDGTLFLGALKMIAWLAWATFALSVVVEIPAQLREPFACGDWVCTNDGPPSGWPRLWGS